MSIVIGRSEADGPTVAFGSYRARDGSAGARVELDCDRPHAAVVVGKRGYGKSYTLGVLAEGLADAPGVAPVIVDPLGVFRSLADGDVPARVVRPTVAPNALPPPAWPDLFGLDPTDPVGALLWQTAASASSLEEMRASVPDADAARETRRAAVNYLSLASSWDVFAPEGLTACDLCGEAVTVLDCSRLDDAPAGVVVRAVARSLYDARVSGTVERLPWLLLDEAHVFFRSVAAPALRTVLTRGRHPGVSLVCATQRPSALPDVAVSQSDLTVAHRLTARTDREALERVRPSYLDRSLGDRMPTRPGDVVVVDDTTETAHALRVRERRTPHGGASPRASAVEHVTGEIT